MIAIIDYGMGNIHSVQKALESFGAKTLVASDPHRLRDCKKMVLPGVGAFKDAVLELKGRGIVQEIERHIENKKPFLGICLGLQLLFEESQESKGVKGLGLLKGMIKRFENKRGFKIPHMGWNQLKLRNEACPLLKDIADNSYVYFCHSYYPQPSDKHIIAATTDYGIDFTSIIYRDNIYGLQFHPEKSQRVGLMILKNFVEL